MQKSFQKINHKNKKILSDVKNQGDKAVIRYEKKFSMWIILNQIKLNFLKMKLKDISKKVDKDLKKSIDVAFDKIKRFHLKQRSISFKYTDKYKNELSYQYSPIDSVGVYVPGGTASYPSTVLMNCIPAIVAGVKNIYLTTPTFGLNVNPAIIYAAKKCRVKRNL